jgi:hypothetical protein
MSENPGHSLLNLADLTSSLRFCSTNEPGQWVCWDFHGLRIRPTHYTIERRSLESWVIESSLDGEAWMAIDRKTDNEDFNSGWAMPSFAVSNSAECRFTRLTQMGKINWSLNPSSSSGF